MLFKLFRKPTLQVVAQRKLDEVNFALFNARGEEESIQAHIAMLEQRRSRLAALVSSINVSGRSRSEPAT